MGVGVEGTSRGQFLRTSGSKTGILTALTRGTYWYASRMVDVNISVGTVRAGHDLTWVLIIITMSKLRLRTNNSTESEGRAAG